MIRDFQKDLACIMRLKVKGMGAAELQQLAARCWAPFVASECEADDSRPCPRPFVDGS